MGMEQVVTGAIHAGAAVVDVTPPAGLAMAFYAARSGPAVGAHDPITVRALAVGDTAIVSVDVCGLHEDFCARVRDAIRASDVGIGEVVVAATHTHSGPTTMPDRLGDDVDEGYVAALYESCVDAVRRAAERRRPTRLRYGAATDPGIARNRRHPGGPTDPVVPVLRWVDADGRLVAIVVSLACHPVVLGPDNRRWSADYPGVVRSALEAAHPGSVAIFLTGCAGDVDPDFAAGRTFAAVERTGERLATAVRRVRSIEATTSTTDPPTSSARTTCPLEVQGGRPWPAPITVLRWGGVRVVALPGEPFNAAARRLRQRVPGPLVVAGYADGCAGYLPTREAYAHGGYEVDEAHRYYGMPGPFAPGSLERLMDAAARLAGPTPIGDR
jgi:neutral ceramidase